MVAMRGSRRLAALLGACLLGGTVLVVMNARRRLPGWQDSEARYRGLDDQLESAQWRDAAEPEPAPGAAPERPPVPALTERARLPSTASVSPSVCRHPTQLGVIFTRADQQSRMRPSLVRTLQTLAARSPGCFNVNVFIDDASRDILDQTLAEARLPARFTISQHAIAPMADQMRSLIEVMQRFFAPRKGTYYNDVLFFLTTTMHGSLPSLDRLIMIDLDVSVREDVALLEAHFERFAPENVMGLSHELSPVYRHVLKEFRERTGNTTAGGPPPRGFPGLNSGVVLLDLARMRRSTRYNTLITPEEIERRAARYSFKGHLGDQDLYTLLALDDPQLFYTLPCGWNRQLCSFWRGPYGEVFEEYFRCDGPIYIYHGNCKAPIPTEGETRI